jgi:hypothetical protein
LDPFYWQFWCVQVRQQDINDHYKQLQQTTRQASQGHVCVLVGNRLAATSDTWRESNDIARVCDVRIGNESAGGVAFD